MIENRPGGAGVIGAKAVAGAEPDGYTLLFGNVSTLAVIPAVTRNRDYDPAKKFRAGREGVRQPGTPGHRSGVAGTHASASSSPTPRPIPARSTTARRAMATPRISSAEWFKAKTGVDIVHVPYKGLSDAADRGSSAAR